MKIQERLPDPSDADPPPIVGRYVDVAGTWTVRDGQIVDWNSPTSYFSQFRRQHGLAGFESEPSKLYEWSTDLNGLPNDGGHADWDAGGRALYDYFVPPLLGRPAVPPSQVHLFSHSHGLQCVLYACGKYGLKIDVLVDVAGPVRADMMDVARAARPNIRLWLHLHSGFKDRWQWLGELFDGHFGIVRAHPLANVNAVMPGGHGDVLRDPALFHCWVDQGWLGWMLPAAAGA